MRKNEEASCRRTDLCNNMETCARICVLFNAVRPVHGPVMGPLLAFMSCVGKKEKGGARWL